MLSPISEPGRISSEPIMGGVFNLPEMPLNQRRHDDKYCDT
jgi:hypothetical protein